MKAFNVTIGNSSRTIALNNPGVLNVTVVSVDSPDTGNDTDLRLGGLDGLTNTHVSWSSLSLEVGDTVVIKVLEDCEGDPPDEERVPDQEEEQERLKQYVRDQAEKLGWSISEGE